MATVVRVSLCRHALTLVVARLVNGQVAMLSLKLTKILNVPDPATVGVLEVGGKSTDVRSLIPLLLRSLPRSLDLIS